ncbi:MAG: DNA recombination protein RmuC, partial [Oscillospiraceae bacterium]|nr:DNA recombination protein RmuC [Oscillospiraceae bacterium]
MLIEGMLIALILLSVAIIALLFTRKPERNAEKLAKLEAELARLEGLLREEFRVSRGESQAALKANREELAGSIDRIREAVETRLRSIQSDNNQKLDEMRKTVDDKLSETISKRFSESFNMISERLEQVQQGLGAMTTLASDVGGLKKVL